MPGTAPFNPSAAKNDPAGPSDRMQTTSGVATSDGNGARLAVVPELAPVIGVIPKWKRPAKDRNGTSNPTVTVVIPTLNEAVNLAHVLSRFPDMVDEVVIVDGRSTDGTVEVARTLLPDCVIGLENRPGKGVALRSGLEIAEVPSFECDRIHGTSNPHVACDGIRIARTIIKELLRSFQPQPPSSAT